MKDDMIYRRAAISLAHDLLIKDDAHYNQAINNYAVELTGLTPAQPKIIYCKDCKKHNVEFGYADEICPLISIRGKAKEHEFDYQFCVYGKRK